jgi:hypothetical protein
VVLAVVMAAVPEDKLELVAQYVLFGPVAFVHSQATTQETCK